MKDRKPFLNDELRPMLAASSVGTVFVISIVLGSLFGWWLDGKFGTKPYLTIFFMCIGIASGVKNAIYFIKKSGTLEKIEEEKDVKNLPK
ncbi:MAG: AtpZ/AtpI family protein [Deferribacteraceae bacterium]|jgi:ATP synthase protein I|nr:AtpZ/AtpI family protein [Deferribacteraceae bacterium]